EEFQCGKWVNNTPEDFNVAMHYLLQQNREDTRRNARSMAFRLDWSNIALMYKEVFVELTEKK
ncbi:MAG: hypothetical protein H7259_01975, partial [Cytophagales bacterium]|nr:hypothetical protein [Cytophaga sp.]